MTTRTVLAPRALMPDYLRLFELFGIVVVNVQYIAFSALHGFACQRQSKSEPKGSAKCCHFGFGIISVKTSASIRAAALVI